jgi:hypothetical protein
MKAMTLALLFALALVALCISAQPNTSTPQRNPMKTNLALPKAPAPNLAKTASAANHKDVTANENGQSAKEKQKRQATK